jgi:hypothetical protein
VNVAVLGSGAKNVLTLVPLVIAHARRPRPRSKTFSSLAAAGSSGDIFI